MEDVKEKIDTLLAPSAANISSNYLQLGNKYARTLAIVNYPRYINTNWFSPIINMDRELDISIFVHPQDTGFILKKLRDKLTHLEAQVMTEQAAGKVRDPIVDTAINDIESLRDQLQQGTDRFFQFGIYVTIYADSVKELDEIEGRISGILDAQLIYHRQATFRMKEGFLSTIPTSSDLLSISTSLNTQPISSVFPFVSLDLTSDKGILYGINSQNNSLVLFDRFSLQNANTVVLGQAGGGKSYAVKLEILRSLIFGTQVFVIDPEDEYKSLAESVGGTTIEISISSESHINPFDLPKPLPDETPDGVLKDQILSISGLMTIMLGQLSDEERAILDEAITQTYAVRDITAASDFNSVQPPTMADLQNVLEGMTGATSLVTRIKRYTSGSFGGFLNNLTNVSMEGQFVVFSIRDMQEELKPIAMYLVLNYIWTQIRTELKKRILVVDEAWILLKNSAGGEFLFGIAKRARKYFLGLTTISQEVDDLLSSPNGKPILNNSSIRLLFNQKDTAINLVKEAFGLTESEKFYLLEAPVGHGLFFAGSSHIALNAVSSYAENQIVSSDPRHLLEIEEAKKELASS